MAQKTGPRNRAERRSQNRAANPDVEPIDGLIESDGDGDFFALGDTVYEIDTSDVGQSLKLVAHFATLGATKESNVADMVMQLLRVWLTKPSADELAANIQSLDVMTGPDADQYMFSYLLRVVVTIAQHYAESDDPKAEGS